MGELASTSAKLRSRKAPLAAEGERKASRHQDAVAELRKMITSGELPPGEPLREVPLSQRLGMSRTPVREAFRTLLAEGLVELLPNRRMVVCELDAEEATDVFRFLGAIEALAAQQACERMSKDEINEIRSLQAEMDRAFAAGDRPAYSQINRRVHEAIVLGSGNAALILAWRLILPRAERARSLNTLDRASWSEFLKDHQDMVDALASRDAAMLAGLMRGHFREAVERTTRRMLARAGKAAPGPASRSRRT